MTEKKPAKKQPAKKVPAKKAPAKKPTAKTPAKKTPAKTSNSSTPAKKRGRPPKTAATSAAPTQPEIVINVTTKHSTNHIKNLLLNTYRKLVKTNQKRG